MPTALTSDTGQQTIALSEWGPDATGRERGQAARERVLPEAREVIFDCEGIESMSASFADELFGKLAVQPGRPHIRVINAAKDILEVIRFAVNERTA